jgi:hypothetical protein
MNLLAFEALVQVAFQRILEFVPPPDFRHAAVEDLLPTTAHLRAVGVVYDLVDKVPIYQGDEVLGYIYNIFIRIHRLSSFYVLAQNMSKLGEEFFEYHFLHRTVHRTVCRVVERTAG